MKQKVLIYSLLAGIAFPAFSQNESFNSTSINRFTLDLYHSEADSSDFLMSPTSVSLAMAMVYLGATGETKDEIKETFYYPDDNKFGSYFKTLQEQLGSNISTSLSIANKIWPDQNAMRLNKDFVSLNKEIFDVTIDPVPLRSDLENALREINTWTSENTNNKINDFLKKEDIPPRVCIILTNALYFNGQWSKKFDPSMTIENDFTNDKGKIITASYMADVGFYGYLRNQFAEIVEIPYAGDEFSFLILLPTVSMNELEDNLTPENYSDWTLNLRSREFKLLEFPKFNMSFRSYLAKKLVGLGVEKAFSESQAELDGMGTSDGNIYLAKVIHEAIIEVNEEGTEAAAVTAILGATRSMKPPPITFKANRPFIYMIRDIRSNTILFIGKMSNPSY